MQTERRPEGVADTLARARQEIAGAGAQDEGSAGYGFTIAGFLIGVAALLAHIAGAI